MTEKEWEIIEPYYRAEIKGKTLQYDFGTGGIFQDWNDRSILNSFTPQAALRDAKSGLWRIKPEPVPASFSYDDDLIGCKIYSKGSEKHRGIITHQDEDFVYTGIFSMNYKELSEQYKVSYMKVKWAGIGD